MLDTRVLAARVWWTQALTEKGCWTHQVLTEDTHADQNGVLDTHVLTEGECWAQVTINLRDVKTFGISMMDLDNGLENKPSTRNPKPETRNPKPETQNPEPEIVNPKPKTRNPTPETRNPTP